MVGLLSSCLAEFGKYPHRETSARTGHRLSSIADCSNGSDCPTVSFDRECCRCIGQAVEHTFFKKTTGNLRGHSLKLYHKPVRLDITKFFFSQRIVDNWNRLPEEAVSASSLSAFKKKLDN